MKKVFFALILVFISGISFKAKADIKNLQEECLGIVNPPKVRVTSSYGKLRYNFEKDQKFFLAETQKRFQQQGQIAPGEVIPIGLTKVRDGFDFSMTIGKVGISHGNVCLYPEKIDIHLGYYVPTIYILDSLEKDTCLYKMSLQHEKTHMQIYIEALDYFLPELKAVSNKLFDRIGVKILSPKDDVESAAEDLNTLYLSSIQDKVNAWRKEVEIEQLKLDTAEHYLIETRLCEELDAKED